MSSVFSRRLSTIVLGLCILAAPHAGAQAPAKAISLDDMVNLVNVAAGDLSADGRWLVVRMASTKDNFGSKAGNYNYGDLTYRYDTPSDLWVVDTKTGTKQRVFSDRRTSSGGVWSPDASTLALTSIVNGEATPLLWDRASGKTKPIALPAGYVLEGTPAWSDDGKRITLMLHTVEWRRRSKAVFDSLTGGPIVVLDSKDPFLEWDGLGRRRDIRAFAMYDVASAKTTLVLPEAEYASIELSPDGSSIRYSQSLKEKTDYSGISAGDMKISVRQAEGATPPRVVIPTTKGLTVSWAKDGRHYAYTKEKSVYIGVAGDSAPKPSPGASFVWAPEGLAYAYMKGDDTVMVGKFGEAERRFTVSLQRRTTDPAASDTTAEAKAKRARIGLKPSQLSKSGRWAVLANRDGQWILDTQTGAADRMVNYPAEESEAPQVAISFWTPDESAVYYTVNSRVQWDKSLMRYEPATRRATTVKHDENGVRFAGFRLSKDGSTLIYTMANGYVAGNYYATDLTWSNPRQLTDANPWMRERAWGKSSLFEYLDADGKKLKGVLYYPVDYQAGKAYPTVFEIYETMFDDRYSPLVAYLNANGYVVAMPSVNLEMGWPGVAWQKGVTAAANKLIEMGVADSARLGVEGTSYGGYATNLLITQTKRFKAAVNISGKTDMISFYTDSPRLGVRNIWAPEGQQDRLGGTFWQMPLKYLEHSAVYYADRITTPLMLMTGWQDPNVPARTTMEMYYALRRLGKTAVWVNYVNSGHGTPNTSETDYRDYHTRIVAWFDKYLKTGNVTLSSKTEEKP